VKTLTVKKTKSRLKEEDITSFPRGGIDKNGLGGGIRSQGITVREASEGKLAGEEGMLIRRHGVRVLLAYRAGSNVNLLKGTMDRSV